MYHRFVGRQEDLSALDRLMTKSRLVTVTGPPGVGKSRLVAEYAATWPGRTAAVDLGDGRAVGGADLRRAADAVGGSGLLILDTCERAIDLCAAELTDLLRVEPGCRVLATSREALGVAGQPVLRLRPLPAAAARALFLDRAASHDPGVGTIPGELIDSICAPLDGLPLAIELAAARMLLLSPPQLADRLADHAHLLAEGGRRIPARHRGFGAALDWSHDLLAEPERRLLRGLSVFSGSFGLEDAEYVCPDPGVLGGLAALADSSLIECEVRPTGARYSLLGVVRQYGRRILEAAGETRGQRLRHVRWVTELANRVRRAGGQDDLRARLDDLAARGSDTRAALEWCAASGEAAAGLALATALGMYWLVRGAAAEGREWFERFLPGHEGQVPAGSLLEYGSLACALGDYEAARAAGEQALERFEKEGNDLGRLSALVLLGNVKVLTDPESGGKLLDEVCARAGERGGGAWWSGMALALLGCAQSFTGPLAAAREACEACVAAARGGGGPLTLLTGEIALGHVAIAQGDHPAAERTLGRSLVSARELGHPQGVALALHGLGALACARGRRDQARALLGEAVAEARLSGSPVILASCLNERAAALLRYGEAGGDGEARRLLAEVFELGERATVRQLTMAVLTLAEVEEAAGRSLPARTLAEEGELLARRNGDRTMRARALHIGGRLARRRGEASAALAAHREGLLIQMDLGLPADLADSMEDFAGLAAEQGRAKQAAAVFGGARALRERLGLVRGPSRERACRAGWDLVGAALPVRQAEALAAEGARQPVEELLATTLRGRRPARGSTGWTVLTGAEHQVARLAAEGLTNKQIGDRLFISPRTAQTHLSHVFTKLGVRSRHELAERFSARGDLLGAAVDSPLFRLLGLPERGASCFIPTRGPFAVDA